jgi:uncharacterized membrane protein
VSVRHRHRPGSAPGSRVAHVRIIAAILVAAALATIAGLVALWPSHHPTAHHGQLVRGVVTATTETGCDTGCQVQDTVALTSGPEAGRSTTLMFTPGPTDPKLRRGEHILLGRAAGPPPVYQFADIQRGRPLLALAVIFAVVVIVIGRVKGLAAIAGLVVAGTLVVVFVLPALLAGESPTWVAVVAGAAIVLAVLPLSHGVSAGTGAAMLGTLTGMTIAAAVTAVAAHALHVTGLSSDEGATLQLLGGKTTASGLLLCGAVIGTLGVLNDVTVTQASAVFELAESNPALSRRGVYASAMRVGRDHIASTVYSLVLAYTGAALPVLLLFSLSDQSVATVLTSDSLAPELAAGLIGATALVLVVPLTTLIAAAALARTPQPTSSAATVVTYDPA